MKKLFMLSIFGLTLVFASNSFAAGYGAAGCGPGSIFFKKNTRTEQMMSWLTNFIVSQFVPSVQTSAISSDVSNCGSSKLVLSSKEDEQFVERNFDNLTKEMAAGKGESLSILSSLFGCEGKDSEFAAFTQSNYDVLLESENTTYSDMLVALKNGLSSDPILLTSCKTI